MVKNINYYFFPIIMALRHRGWCLIIIGVLFLTLPQSVIFTPGQAAPVLEFNYDRTISTDLNITGEITWLDETIFVEHNLTVTSKGSLTLINVTLVFNNTLVANNSYRVEAGGRFFMQNSQFSNCGIDELNPGLEIFSNNISIVQSQILGNFVGITLHNISGVTIDQSTFTENEYGMVLKNCNDVRFIGCNFSNNSQAALTLVNSGNETEIELDNCTLFQNLNTSIKAKNSVEIFDSKLKMVNITNNTELEKLVKFNGESNLFIYWYLHLRLMDDKDQGIGFVHISIQDSVGNLVLNDTETDNIGRLGWIKLLHKKYGPKGETINYNPYELTASKKGYADRTVQFVIPTTEVPKVVILKKAEEEPEDDFMRTIYLVCVCGIVVFLVFVIFMAINVRLMKRRLDASGLRIVEPGLGGAKGTGANGEDIVTCSECGTQVTADVKFCPHCGEYFEGEEFTCPGCGAVVQEDDTTCSKCGRIFDKSSASMKSRAGKKRPDKVITEGKKKTSKKYCSECGAVVSDDEERCPGCGLLFEIPKHLHKIDTKKSAPSARRLTEAEEVELEHKGEQKKGKTSENLYMCSICGAEINEESKRCPKCGIEFE
ncbi:zinc ribbon domain-containing protein [[Eubacterium] cellulosolvens]